MERLKMIPVLAVFVLAAACVAAVQSPNAPPAASPFTISITAPQPTVKAGSPVEVEVSLTNTSSEMITVRGSFLLPYDIEVRDPKGDLAPLTEQGRDWKRRLQYQDALPRSGPVGKIKPGETVKTTIAVTRFYDMSSPGIYKIQFHRDQPGKRGIAHSNTVTVTVIP